jgi:hypothetical protein
MKYYLKERDVKMFIPVASGKFTIQLNQKPDHLKKAPI